MHIAYTKLIAYIIYEYTLYILHSLAIHIANELCVVNCHERNAFCGILCANRKVVTAFCCGCAAHASKSFDFYYLHEENKRKRERDRKSELHAAGCTAQSNGDEVWLWTIKKIIMTSVEGMAYGIKFVAQTSTWVNALHKQTKYVTQS